MSYSELTDPFTFRSGDLCQKKIDKSPLVILKQMTSSYDEREMGPKYLARTLNHQKIVIHEVEIESIPDDGVGGAARDTD